MNSPYSTKRRNQGPKKDSEERLVEAARQLFFSHGVRRVPVEEICEAAQVSKMTFYRHFPDKTAVALRVLEDVAGRMRRQIREVELLDLPFEAKLRKIFEIMLEDERTHGRAFFAGLLKGADPSLERFLEDERLQSLQQLRSLIATAQRLGELRKDIKAELIIHMLHAARETLAEKDLLVLYPDQSALMREAFSLFHEGAGRR